MLAALDQMKVFFDTSEGSAQRFKEALSGTELDLGGDLSGLEVTTEKIRSVLADAAGIDEVNISDSAILAFKQQLQQIMPTSI